MVLLGTATLGGVQQARNAEADDEEEANMAALASSVLTPEMVPVLAEMTGIPVDALEAYGSAGAVRDVDWAILAGIGKVECDHGQNTAAGCNPRLIDSASGKPQVNDVGARGPMQFLGSTWRAGSVATDPDVSGPPVPEGGGYATDGDGDGIADPWNWFDATHATARYLVALGVEDNPECAVFGYNQGGGAECDPSHDYPTKVMEYADEYRSAAGLDQSAGGSLSVATGECPSGRVTGSRSPSAQHHVTPATQAMVNGVVECFGRGRYGFGCYDPRSDDPKFEHPRGRACDFMTSDDTSGSSSVERARGDAMAAWLRANAEELDVLYVIWYERIWSAGRADEGWRPYSGDSPHRNHVHVSVGLQPGDPSWARCNPNYSCSE